MPVPQYVLLAALATGTPLPSDAQTGLTLGLTFGPTLGPILGPDAIVQPNGGAPTRLACGGVVQKDADCGGGGGPVSKDMHKEKEVRHPKAEYVKGGEHKPLKPIKQDKYLQY
jgi:hypothetical protein